MYYKYIKSPKRISVYENLVHAPNCFVPEEDRVDNAALKVHLDRLGNGCVMRLGYNFAIYDRQKNPLDPADINACAKRAGESILVPAPFVREYFGEELAADGEGYVDLTAACTERNFALYVDADTGLICFTPPKAVMPVTAERDPEFIKRMAFVYEDPRLPMPRYNNTQATRTVVAFEGGYPEDDIDLQQKDYVNLYSPSILIRYENGKKIIYVSHENAYGMPYAEISTETVLRRSDDDGKTWTKVCTWQHMRWTYLFEVKGDIYMCGSHIVEGGFSHSVWVGRVEGNTVKESLILAGVAPLTNPNAVVVANGRVMIPTFPCMMSASIDSNLLDPASWSRSNSLNDIIPKDWFLEASGCTKVKIPDYWPLEGNLIKSPDGSLHNLMRLEIYPYNGYAALIDISPDGLVQSRNPACNGLVEMPISVSKFCVRYDAASKLYLALTPYPSLGNLVPCGGPPMAGQRNILAFAASPDLIRWKTLDILLCDTEVMNAFCSARAHAFQYVVWEFDGDDILFVVREACGFTKHYHDGKYVTMYRLENYRKLIDARYGQCEFFKNER